MLEKSLYDRYGLNYVIQLSATGYEKKNERSKQYGFSIGKYYLEVQQHVLLMVTIAGLKCVRFAISSE